MRLFKNKKLIAAVLIVAGIVGVALWPESMEVSVVHAERGPMQVTVEGKHCCTNGNHADTE